MTTCVRSCDMNLMDHVAYRKFHSTETALFKVQNDVFQSLDQTNVTILVLMDLSAAFDTIDHQTLLRRVEHHYGVNPNMDGIILQ